MKKNNIEICPVFKNDEQFKNTVLGQNGLQEFTNRGQFDRIVFTIINRLDQQLNVTDHSGQLTGRKYLWSVIRRLTDTGM